MGGGLGEAPQAERGKAWPLRWAWLYSDQRTYTPYLEKALSLREESLPLSLGGSQSEDRGRWAGLEGAGPLGVQASVKVRKAEQGPEGHLHPHGDQPGVRPWLGGGCLSDWPQGTFSGCDRTRSPKAKQSLPLAPPGLARQGGSITGLELQAALPLPPCPPPTHAQAQTHTPAHADRHASGTRNPSTPLSLGFQGCQEDRTARAPGCAISAEASAPAPSPGLCSPAQRPHSLSCHVPTLPCSKTFTQLHAHVDTELGALAGFPGPQRKPSPPPPAAFCLRGGPPSQPGRQARGR